MLVLLRIIFALALWYVVRKVHENARFNPEPDLVNAGYLAIGVLVGILNAVVWAPFLGAKVSEPLTEVMTTATFVHSKNRLLQLIYWLQERRYRGLTLLFCFLEGIRHPWLPAAFVIGLRNAPPGSWWERIYAREVFRFNNTQNCVQAYEALKRHGLNPGSHAKAEINLVLFALNKEARPDPEIINVPAARRSAPVKRNPRIQLFELPAPASAVASLPDCSGQESGTSPGDSPLNRKPNPGGG